MGPDTHIWDVRRLVRLAMAEPVIDLPLSALAELDENWWYDAPEAVATPRSVAAHMRLVQAADLSFPIILSADGRLMDGMHRAVKALVEGRRSIAAIRLSRTPPPDYVNVALDQLPYDEADQ
ncbi:MAG: hypothetical protein AAF914_12175 [Pseudomonadota bacterium]